MGIPPTNKRITWLGIEVDRIASGKVVEIWALVDAMGLMQQLGVIPTPGKGK
jgi:predicted ester cyclase